MEISKIKSFTVVRNITERVREAAVVLGGESFLQLIGLKDVCF